MKAEILSIGTELLMGELTDTNASWIAARLPALGIQLQWVSIIGDDLGMLAEACSRGWQRSDLILTTGGLGPTQDDLTREAIAKALGETPTVQEQVVKELERYFQDRGITMPTHNIKQAYLIPSARFIPTATAPRLAGGSSVTAKSSSLCLALLERCAPSGKRRWLPS